MMKHGRLPRARVAVALLAVATAFALTMGGSVGAVASASNQDSFNSGAFTAGQWTTLNASAIATDAHDNTYFARLTDTGSGAYLNWPTSIVEQNHRYWTVRGFFRVDSRGAGQTVGLLTVKNNSTGSHADLFTDPTTGNCTVDLFNANSATTSFSCADNTWHSVEMKGDFGATTYTLDWKVDGLTQTSVSSTGQTATTVKSLWLGDSTTGKASVQNWDDVRLDVSDSPQSFLGTTTSY
jgi:hypothetical protein